MRTLVAIVALALAFILAVPVAAPMAAAEEPKMVPAAVPEVNTGSPAVAPKQGAANGNGRSASPAFVDVTGHWVGNAKTLNSYFDSRVDMILEQSGLTIKGLHVASGGPVWGSVDGRRVHIEHNQWKFLTMFDMVLSDDGNTLYGFGSQFGRTSVFLRRVQ